jgi:O-antigen/teichoic acid export membrane protein
MIIDKYFKLKFKARNLVKNFSYTFSSNLIGLIISSLVVFIMPKLVGVEEYGYYQLFLFYSSYATFLLFGWTEGIYLRYGGAFSEDLDKQLLFSQFIMLLIFQSLIALSIMFYAIFSSIDLDRKFIIQATAAFMFLTNIRFLFLHVLQATNRFKYYSIIIIISRTIFITSVVFLIVFEGFRNYKLLIIADILGIGISLLYSIYICRDFALLKLKNLSFRFSEAIKNIKIGIQLLFSNTAGMLIVGAFRLGIERGWDIITFGKVSLTLSISRFLMVLINTIGQIIFPVLRRIDHQKLSDIYSLLRIFFTVIILGILVFYYPLKVMLSIWLPEYADSLKYMALLFPITVYEGKMALLVNQYMKTLRKENLLLKINILAIVISILVSILVTIISTNLDLAVVSIAIMLAFRCILAEIILSNILRLNLLKDIVIEMLIVALFIGLSWFINSWLSTGIYFLIFLFYLLIKRKEIKSSFNITKKMVREEKQV